MHPVAVGAACFAVTRAYSNMAVTNDNKSLVVAWVLRLLVFWKKIAASFFLRFAVLVGFVTGPFDGELDWPV